MRDSSRQRFNRFRENFRHEGAQREAEARDHPARADWKTRKSYLREYFSWLRPFAGSIAFLFMLAVASAILGLLIPRATMHIIDVSIRERDSASLHLVGTFLVLIVIAQVAIEVMRKLRQGRLNSRVIATLRQRLFKHFMRLPLHELHNMKTGGITSRLSGDVDVVTGLLQMALITPGVALLRIVMTLVVLVWINWQMAVAAVLLLPPVVFLNLLSINRIRPIYRSMRRDRADIDGRVVETFGGIRVVRAFGRESAEAARYGLSHHTVVRKDQFANVIEAILGAGWGLVLPLSGILVVWVGGFLALRGETTVGEIMAFQMYLLMLLTPVSNIVQSYGQTQQALAAMERVFDILRRPIDKPDRPRAVAAPRTVDLIEFDNVAFSYRAGQPVLQDFSLRVAGGSTIALVGPSGAGKTTVTNLVARFYDPDEGAIRLNGIDLRDIRLQSYRGLLGLVQQDVFLFDGTIAENIAFGRRGASEAEIESAARRANAHEFITAFPDGYETLVGERGVRLSGGQAQRISIARAILADPAILILDEATSNLDSESEQLIQMSLRELLADRTTFVIAHRLSTVVSADLIVVLEAGRIVETGTHADLMAADARYRAMVERQQGSLKAEAEAAGWLG
jgi:ATP-binding cassette subfamily B protein/subfamily B ATP-binding cassette protein MsbA